MKKILAVSIAVMLLFFSTLLTFGSSISENNTYNLSKIHLLIKDPRPCFFPSFSSDGENIVFVQRSLSGEETVCVASSDGRNITIIYKNNSSIYYPKFSPDGGKIAFIEEVLNSTTNESYSQICVFTKNGSWESDNLKKESIYRLDTEDFSTSSIASLFWASDEKIIFGIYSPHPEKKGMWSITQQGTNLTKISSYIYNVISPNSKKTLKIMLDEGDEGAPELWIMNIDGSEQKRLLDSTWLPYMATFAPDGEIVFSAGRYSIHDMGTSPPNIWIMGQDGSNKRMIVPGDSFASGIGCLYPSVSPNMKKLVFTTTAGFLYYIDDPTGEWKDSDGDGVYDGIDGAPNDPYMGYIGENPTMSWIMRNIVPILAATIAVIAVSAYVLRRSKNKEKAVSRPPEDENPRNEKYERRK